MTLTSEQQPLPSGGTRLKKWLQCVNVEPVIFLNSVSQTLATTSMSVYVFWACCMQLNEQQHHRWHLHRHSNLSDYCQTLATQVNGTTELTTVEAEIARWNIYLSLTMCISLIVAPVCSTLSDRYARRLPPLLYNLTGSCVVQAVLLATTFLWPDIVIWYPLLLASIFNGLRGGNMLFLGASFALVTDAVRDGGALRNEGVPTRIALATGLNQLGALCGQAAALLLRQWAGIAMYNLGVGVALVLSVLSVLYCVLFVKDSTTTTPTTPTSTTAVRPAVGFSCTAVRDAVCSVLDVLTVRRRGWHRFCLNVALVGVCAELLAIVGDGGVMLLLLKSVRFAWSDQLLIAFGIFMSLVFTLGVFLWPPLFKLSNVPYQDMLMILIGLGSCIVSTMVTAFATSTDTLFIAGSLGFLISMMGPAMRSFIPKLVSKEETARVFTVFGVMVQLTPVVAPPIFNSIYEATLAQWTGWVFVCAAAMQTCCFVGFIFVFLGVRATELYYPTTDEDDEALIDNDNSLLESD